MATSDVAIASSEDDRWRILAYLFCSWFNKLVRTKSYLLVYLIVAILGSFPFEMVAADSFDLKSKVVQLDEERGSTTIWTLKQGEARFSFIAPHTWQVNAQSDRKLVLMSSSDSTSIINLQVTNTALDLKLDADLKKMREMVKKRFPDGRVLEEFTCHSGSGNGLAFDLEVLGDKHQSFVRHVFVPIKDFTLDLVIRSPLGNIEESKLVIARLLNSFELVKEGEPQK